MEELEIYYNNKKLLNDDFLKPSETQVEPKIKYKYLNIYASCHSKVRLSKAI